MLAAKPINEVITCMRLTHAAQALMQGRPPSGTFVLVPPVARIRHAGTHETPPSCWNLYCGARGRWGFGCVAHIAARRPSWKTKGVSEKHHTRSSDLATKEARTACSDQSLKVDARGIELTYHRMRASTSDRAILKTWMSREVHETRTQYRLLRSNGLSGSAAHSTSKTCSAPPPTTADSIEYGVTIYPAALNRIAKQWLPFRSSMKIAMLPSTLWGRVKISAFAASNLLQL